MMEFFAEVQRRFNRIVAKAWADEEFKRRLMAEPAQVLAEEGIQVPKGIEVRVVENTPRVFYLTLPPKPPGELCDDDLDSVSGGIFQSHSPWD